ncbi:MAG: gamma-glutamyl-gamma-aminobutyrate hydrolase family protein [Clostridia bacterium]|nr:gamma-glutamyl-gamma-aminobutyrate hydrolase family protein [Clostridia bacterium]
MLLIIDNQSSFIKRFKRNFLSEQNIEYRFIDHNEPLVIKKDEKVEGIILSGGKGNPYEPLNLTANFVALMNYNVPIIGFCLGYEIIGVAYMGRIKRMEKYNQRTETVRISKMEDPIFQGLLSDEITLRKQHQFELWKMPPDFINLGSSDTCDIEIIKHKDKPIYGFQSHPEVSGINGLLIIRNFLNMCGFEVM